MKKTIILFVGIILLISAISTTTFAEDNLDVLTIYDSVNIPEEEMKQMVEMCQEEYDFWLNSYRTKEAASAEAGYDIDLLLKNDGVVKLYRYDPRKEIIAGTDIDVILADSEKNYLIKTLDEEKIYANCDDDVYKQYLYGCEKKFAMLCGYALNGAKLFPKVEAFKDMTNIEIQGVYFVENPNGNWKPLAYPYRPSIMIYYVTNHGDFVYHCAGVEDYVIIPYDGYLFPIDVYRDLLVRQEELQKFYCGWDNSEENRLEGLLDVSEYWVHELSDTKSIDIRKNKRYEFLVRDKEYLGYFEIYFLAKGMGYENLYQFDSAIKKAGYIGGVQMSGYVPAPFDVSDTQYGFLEDMRAAGYTTYAECRAALDAMIAANSLPTETQPTPTPTPSKLWHLAWIIPVAVLVPTAVAVPIIVMKKRKKKDE